MNAKIISLEATFKTVLVVQVAMVRCGWGGEGGG